MSATPNTHVISFRNARRGPWNAHAFALTDLVGDAFGADVLHAHDPSAYSHRVLASSGRRLDIVRRLPGRATVRSDSDSGPTPHADLLFVVCHDTTDLDLLFMAEPDWVDSATTKVLVLIEVWAHDAERWPTSFARVLPHFDAVFCTLEAGTAAAAAAGGVAVETLPQAVDVLATPFHEEPRVDVLTIGRRHPSQHRLISAWAAESGGWYHFDTLPALGVEDVMLHRQVTAELLARSAVSVCNYARFNDVERIGSTRCTGTRFFETLASGALIAGDLPTDDMFTSEFGDAPGVRQLPLDCGRLDTAAIAELVAVGRDPGVRRANRALALGHQDLAHRLRRILERIDVAEPVALTERFAELERQRSLLV